MRYARGVDRLDPDLVRDAYWPEAIDRHGSRTEPRDAMVDYLMARLATWEASSHMLGQSLVLVEGARAGVETYFQALHLRKGEPRICDQVVGRYADRFERRGRHWRILQREVIIDWTAEQALGPEMPVPVEGRRDRDDPSWRLGSGPFSAG